ncbi:hypothetical protein J2W91_002117 [Paenibacillus amylolyticus]|uniref:Uncharacterized protein n=1 Tax=Paenibacillus amylolyticus TaxID=1451 RepID=A0AAP5H1N8_PAEAM|nr:hypothetical protein [Paenibacillus amylolyticus]MDR6723655.1 hypothetical protein [Paenibacillus amylolyticus]
MEDQIEKLSILGIRLNPELNINDLLEGGSRAEFEKDPFQSLLICLGGEIHKNEKWYEASEHVCYLDTECIEDQGDYVWIIEKLIKMTKVDIYNVKDTIRPDLEEAMVSFEYNNQQIEWKLNFEDDWLDLEIFYRFNQLINEERDKRIAVMSLDQSCLIAYLTQAERKVLNKLLKYKFQ